MSKTENAGGVSVAEKGSGSVKAGSPIVEPETDNTKKVVISIDNAVRTLADQFYARVISGLPEGRVLVAAEEIALKKKCTAKALQVKKLEQKEREERQAIAELLAVEVMDGLSFLTGNAELIRFTLDKVAQTTILHRVGQRGTRPGSEDEDAIVLADDLDSLLGDIDLEACLDEMTDLRDIRTRSLSGTKKKKVASEDDPVMIEINTIVPTLRELIMTHGETVARYCMKAIGKQNDFSVIRMKAAE